MAERPSISIIFNQLANTLIERSGNIPVVLMIEGYNIKSKNKYLCAATEVDDIDKSEFLKYASTASGEKAYRAVQYCFGSAPAQVYISNYSFKETKEMLIARGETNFIVVAIDESTDTDTAIANSIVETNKAKGYGITGIFRNKGLNLHDTHIINVAEDEYATYYGSIASEKLSDYEVLGLYAGVIATCGVNRSITNYTLPLIEKVVNDSSTDGYDDLTSNGYVYAEMQSGKARVVAGVNTAETGNNVTEDMQHIEFIQIMDMNAKDIRDVFINNYRGAYKNNYDRQLVFIAAINSYFAGQADDEILDPNFSNVCDVDVDSQRNAWIAKGKSEAEDWDDGKVKLMSYGRKVFLKANIKPCQSMEDMTMYITLE